MCAHLIPTLCESFIHSLIQIQADMTKILAQCQPTKSITNYYTYSFMICISGDVHKVQSNSKNFVTGNNFKFSCVWTLLCPFVEILFAIYRMQNILKQFRKKAVTIYVATVIMVDGYRQLSGTAERLKAN